MSSDGVDTSDMMSSRSGGDAGMVTSDDLDASQRETYQTLAERAARYVRDGIMTVQDCSLGVDREAVQSEVDRQRRAGGLFPSAAVSRSRGVESWLCILQFGAQHTTPRIRGVVRHLEPVAPEVPPDRIVLETV